MNRLSRDNQDRCADDIGGVAEFKMARRIMAAMAHPDCPVLVLDDEASKLARHIAIRLRRQRGS